MKRIIYLLPVALLFASCISPPSGFPSSDCTDAVPTQFTRIYIGAPSPGGRQSGTSAQDPLDGTTAEKFDTILRTIAEGQRPSWGTQSRIPPQNLIVCINPGVFRTSGQFDWFIPDGHATGTHTKGADSVGFTVEKNWRIHGHGTHQTLLELDRYVTGQFRDSAGNAFTGGRNIVIGTHSGDASGVAISDLTINANHDNLHQLEGLPLNLGAIVLKSFRGGHWIHNVNVVGASGDLGAENGVLESFLVFIWGNSPEADPSQDTGNLIENVTLTRPGSPVGKDTFPGGSVSAIVVTNAVAEIRNTLVEDYLIAYGGWAMGPVWFHDNVASGIMYGFNSDSFNNIGVTIQSNRFIHPASYGIVIGGSGPQQQFSKWKVLNNTIEINAQGAAGIVLRGQVKDSTFSGNTVFSDAPAPPNVIAIWSYSSGRSVANFNNIYQGNRLDDSQRVDFSQDPFFDSNCRFMNRDLQDQILPDFPDNTSGDGGCGTAVTLAQ